MRPHQEGVLGAGLLGRRRGAPCLLQRLVSSQGVTGLCFALAVLVLLSLRLLGTAGASLLAVAVAVSAALPGQPVEPQEHEQGIGGGPEPPVLAGPEEQAFRSEAALLLAALLHLLQQPGHLLLLLLLALPQELLRGRVLPVPGSEHILHDAQQGQDAGDEDSHGLEEQEGEKGLSGAGWEGGGSWGSRGEYARAGARWERARGSWEVVRGRVVSAAGTGTSPHSPQALAVADSPGTPAPSPEGGTCPAPGAPHSGCALAPAVETPLRGQSFCPGPRPAQPSPRRPPSPLAQAVLQRVLPAGTLVTSLGDFSSVMSQAPEPHGDTRPLGHGHCPWLCSPCRGKAQPPWQDRAPGAPKQNHRIIQVGKDPRDH
ncbi:uncharacterized protein LOC141953690 isoform X1 [Strix uralensis]|uniref:uncharacterized protein LOC141953690 isoform X1 n=1 Tax=Strix uralensis TaxID=36305 RepID=UPI003DA70F39